MGRDTLHAIWDEMQQSPVPRPPLVTVGYDEVPVDDPSAPNDGQVRPPQPSGPEITVSETRPGFSTLIAIEEALGDEKSASERPSGYGHARVLELFTFVLLDGSLDSAASEQEKRAFVAERLWHRLPQGGMSTVRRIEVRPADGGALLMRVWCAVPRMELQEK